MHFEIRHISARRTLLSLLIFVEALWTLNLLSVYIAPQSTMYNFEQSYYLVTHVVEIPSLRGAAISEEHAIQDAQAKTLPFLFASVVALGLAILSIAQFKHRVVRRIGWGGSIIVLLLMMILFIYAS